MYVYFFVYLFNTNIKKIFKDIILLQMRRRYFSYASLPILPQSISIAPRKTRVNIILINRTTYILTKPCATSTHMMTFIIYNAMYIDRILWRSRNSIGKREARDLFDVF